MGVNSLSWDREGGGVRVAAPGALQSLLESRAWRRRSRALCKQISPAFLCCRDCWRGKLDLIFLFSQPHGKPSSAVGGKEAPLLAHVLGYLLSHQRPRALLLLLALTAGAGVGMLHPCRRDPSLPWQISILPCSRWRKPRSE